MRSASARARLPPLDTTAPFYSLDVLAKEGDQALREGVGEDELGADDEDLIGVRQH